VQLCRDLVTLLGNGKSGEAKSRISELDSLLERLSHTPQTPLGASQ
jgi:hypothetical protein